MPTNDKRNFYTLISKNIFDTFPVLSVFLERRGPLYHPAVGEDEPVLMTTANSTLKQAWIAYKGSNAMKLVKSFVINEGSAPSVVDYDDAEYISIGLDNVSMKEILEIYTAFQSIPDAIYVPVLTHDDIKRFINTGEIELL